MQQSMKRLTVLAIAISLILFSGRAAAEVTGADSLDQCGYSSKDKQNFAKKVEEELRTRGYQKADIRVMNRTEGRKLGLRKIDERKMGFPKELVAPYPYVCRPGTNLGIFVIYTLPTDAEDRPYSHVFQQETSETTPPKTERGSTGKPSSRTFSLGVKKREEIGPPQGPTTYPDPQPVPNPSSPSGPQACRGTYTGCYGKNARPANPLPARVSVQDLNRTVGATIFPPTPPSYRQLRIRQGVGYARYAELNVRLFVHPSNPDYILNNRKEVFPVGDPKRPQSFKWTTLTFEKITDNYIKILRIDGIDVGTGNRFSITRDQLPASFRYVALY